MKKFFAHLKIKQDIKRGKLCQIALVSLTFSSSMPDLSVWDFEEKLASVKVEGTCQWKIFTGGTLTLTL